MKVTLCRIGTKTRYVPTGYTYRPADANFSFEFVHTGGRFQDAPARLGATPTEATHIYIDDCPKARLVEMNPEISLWVESQNWQEEKACSGYPSFYLLEWIEESDLPASLLAC